MSSFGSPVSDLNASGQVVGASQPYLPSNEPPSFATFSLKNLTSHPNADLYNYADAAVNADNLNRYVASELGIYLSSAVKIDDLGAIIAVGTLDGHSRYFLLTPIDQPTSAPEPTTLVMLAVATIGVTTRRRVRSRRRESELLAG